jgi:hypothetical protein
MTNAATTEVVKPTTSHLLQRIDDLQSARRRVIDERRGAAAVRGLREIDVELKHVRDLLRVSGDHVCTS